MWYVGLDWAETHHDVDVLDETGKRVGARTISHGLRNEIHSWLKRNLCDIVESLQERIKEHSWQNDAYAYLPRCVGSWGLPLQCLYGALLLVVLLFFSGLSSLVVVVSLRVGFLCLNLKSPPLAEQNR